MNVNTAPNVLLIPDGNRRWGRDNGLTTAEAYEVAAARIVEVSHYLGEVGCGNVWFNITRPFNSHRVPDDLDAIFNACTLVHAIGQRVGTPINVALRGDLDSIPSAYRQTLEAQANLLTPGAITTHMLFNWAADTEVTKMVQEAQANSEAPTSMAHLIRASVVNERVDLIVRTGLLHTKHGGRLSGFAPWHSPEAELHFPPVHFPAFAATNMAAALETYVNPEHKNQVHV
jgi:undecaprenyl diphosphate synthase